MNLYRSRFQRFEAGIVRARRQEMSNDSALQSVSANSHSLDGKIAVKLRAIAELVRLPVQRKNSNAESNIKTVAALLQFEPVVCEVSDATEAAPTEVH